MFEGLLFTQNITGCLLKYKNLANYNEGFLYAVRKFLKGDIGSLQAAFEAMNSGTRQAANIVYLTNYNTFTLKDLVSYYPKMTLI